MSNAIKQAHGHLIRIRYELKWAGTAESRDAVDRPIAIAYELAGLVIQLLETQDDKGSLRWWIKQAAKHAETSDDGVTLDADHWSHIVSLAGGSHV